MQEKVTGMVLSGTPVGEYDKRVVILTRERGKISAFARGARRPKSSLIAASEPFTFGEFELYRGRDSYTISSVNVKNYFSDIREELEDIYIGMYFCEVAEYVTMENMDTREILKLLYQSLRALKVPSLSRELVRRIYEFKLIALNGEAPRLFACIECGRKDELFYFHPQKAGSLCEACYEKEPYNGRGAYHISGSTTYILQRIVASPVKTLYTFSVSEHVMQELNLVVKDYFEKHIDKKFQSAQMLDDLPLF